MEDKITKIIVCFLFVILVALLIYTVLDHYRACDKIKSESYNFRVKLFECQEELKIYEEAPILYQDDFYSAIKIKKQ